LMLGACPAATDSKTCCSKSAIGLTSARMPRGALASSERTIAICRCGTVPRPPASPVRYLVFVVGVLLPTACAVAVAERVGVLSAASVRWRADLEQADSATVRASADQAMA
jgi:hypothetical protein